MLHCKGLSFGLLLAALKTTVLAQTAPGFSVQASSTLNVTFGTNNVSPAGELVPRPDTVNPPNITTPVWTSNGKAVLFMVDSDVPRNGTRVELLHWLVSDVTLSGNNTLSFPGPGEAPYRQPSPPVGDTPHAYTLVLFPQPENFSIPSQFTDVLQTRVFFNMSNFVAAAGLGQPIAANYIKVQNLTGTPTQTFPPPRPTNATSASNTSTPEFPGAAPLVLGGGRVFWAGVGTAVVAGIAAFAL
ncbi:PEBP-like protein [Melanomma pulvis-pyrius CBS 109.77]|uniref:PEBP-like protein n=1 Tax=Melanomma pulvis-pyrius CBS 109.77 TaxID=1314802 RepID=A0A6A6X4V3_9PLEO|nr:PEBP-like protein [Melanomma pulvis-pyrius CBS 109.77]